MTTNYEISDKNAITKFVAMENKVETSMEIYSQNMTHFSTKIQSLENVMKDNEMRLKDLVEHHNQVVSRLPFLSQHLPSPS